MTSNRAKCCPNFSYGSQSLVRQSSQKRSFLPSGPQEGSCFQSESPPGFPSGQSFCQEARRVEPRRKALLLKKGNANRAQQVAILSYNHGPLFVRCSLREPDVMNSVSLRILAAVAAPRIPQKLERALRTTDRASPSYASVLLRREGSLLRKVSRTWFLTIMVLQQRTITYQCCERNAGVKKGGA